MPEYTKEDLYDLIINNPAEFNDYREVMGELDLSEMDFSGTNLAEIDFTNCDLSGSSFSEAHLTECKFQNCDLTSCDFTRSNLVECDFSESLLNGTDYSYAPVSYCNFTDADMAGAILIESDLSGSDFSASDNLNATRFDESTVFPDFDLLPDEFDTSSTRDLSSLEDDDEANISDY